MQKANNLKEDEHNDEKDMEELLCTEKEIMSSIKKINKDNIQ